MEQTDHRKIGIIVPCWNSLRQNEDSFASFISWISQEYEKEHIIVLSITPADASPMVLAKWQPHAYFCDSTTLSIPRLARLCERVYLFQNNALSIFPVVKTDTRHGAPRFGFIVSNGFGLGHVTRMRAFGEGLRDFGPQAFMSYSAGLTCLDHAPVYYLPSAQYLQLPKKEDWQYTREATLRFFNSFQPTHVFYDGNVLAPGMLAALAQRPEIYFTWIRRGMWQPDVAPRYVAQQAMADLVIEPGDLSDAYDTGPSWQSRLSYCTALRFLKTPPVQPNVMDGDMLPREAALMALGLDPAKRYALLMLGACQKSEDMSVALQSVAAVRRVTGLVPVIAHWPISHETPPTLEGAIVIEKIPLAPYYKGFEVLVSAAGYNSFHEIMASDRPVVFVPQEDAGRDQQLQRARFAADQKRAAICRRTELLQLDDRIRDVLDKKALPVLPEAWLSDWEGVAKAMGIFTKNQTKTNNYKPSSLGSKDIKRTMRSLYKRWRLRYGTGTAHLVVALDTDFKKIEKKLAAISQSSGGTVIVATDSVDPIALRRAQYKYVWVNPQAFETSYAAKRQILNWIMVWRPGQLTFL